MGPGVPSLAVFFTGARVPSLVVFLSSRPCGTCFIKPSAHHLADSLSGLCFVLQARAAECFFCLAESPSVLTPTAVFATSHTPWHRRDGFPASLSASLPASLPREPPSVTSSRHATHFRWLCYQPSLAAPSEWSAAYVTSLHSPQQWETARSSTCYHTSRCFAWSVHHSRRSRGLPVAPPRAALVAPPS